MNKIIALSTNGFQLDKWYDSKDMGFTKKWFTCDKKAIIDSGRFNSLKVCLELTDIKFNNDGKYVIDFNINVPSVNVVGGKELLESKEAHDPSKNDKPLNSNCPSPSIQESIRYAQCINIAFNNLSHNEIDLTFNGMNGYVNIDLGFELADKIFEKWNSRKIQ